MSIPPSEWKIQAETGANEIEKKPMNIPPFPGYVSEISQEEIKKSLFEMIFDMEKPHPIEETLMDEENTSPIEIAPYLDKQFIDRTESVSKAEIVSSEISADSIEEEINAECIIAPAVFSNPPIVVASITSFTHVSGVSAVTIPAEVSRLFEKMVSTISMMDNHGITETSIHLNNPKYASSPFYGTQIIIQEYSSSPKSFNIQLITSQPHLLQNQLPNLMAAFQNRQLNFTVNRLDLYLPSQESHLVQRKEDLSEEKDDQERRE